MDSKVYLSGSPGRRDWYANLVANPDFVYHLKRSLVADLPARGRLITDETKRRMILTRMSQVLGRPSDVEAWVAGSPLVEVEFCG